MGIKSAGAVSRGLGRHNSNCWDLWDGTTHIFPPLKHMDKRAIPPDVDRVCACRPVAAASKAAARGLLADSKQTDQCSQVRQAAGTRSNESGVSKHHRPQTSSGLAAVQAAVLAIGKGFGIFATAASQQPLGAVVLANQQQGYSTLRREQPAAHPATAAAAVQDVV